MAAYVFKNFIPNDYIKSINEQVMFNEKLDFTEKWARTMFRFVMEEFSWRTDDGNPKFSTIHNVMNHIDFNDYNDIPVEPDSDEAWVKYFDDNGDLCIEYFDDFLEEDEEDMIANEYANVVRYEPSDDENDGDEHYFAVEF